MIRASRGNFKLIQENTNIIFHNLRRRRAEFSSLKQELFKLKVLELHQSQAKKIYRKLILQINTKESAKMAAS